MDTVQKEEIVMREAVLECIRTNFPNVVAEEYITHIDHVESGDYWSRFFTIYNDLIEREITMDAEWTTISADELLVMQCERCGAAYTVDNAEEALEELFGDLADVDEDYGVMVYGLCPHCWPEYR